MADMNFQTFLQARGMSNVYPAQTFHQQPQHPLRTQTAPFVPRFVHPYHNMMASTSAQTSFFADEMYHYGDEQAMFEGASQHLPFQQSPAPNHAFRPLLPYADALPVRAAAAPLTGAMKIESAEQQAVPGVLASHVDRTQYAPVSDLDWARASIEYDVPSPDSVDSSAMSPLTPATDGSESFAEHFFRSDSYANNTVAAAFTAKQQHVNVFAPHHLHPGATSSSFTAPAQGMFYNPAAFTGLVGAHGQDNVSITPAALAMASSHRFPGAHSTTVPKYLPEASEEADMVSMTGHGRGFALSPDFEQEDVSGTEEDPSASSQSSTVNHPNEQRQRDEFLIRMRQQGVPYREIKRRGRFREAESTLRGRVRVLTKEPGERVRRPEWTTADVSTAAPCDRHSVLKVLTTIHR